MTKLIVASLLALALAGTASATPAVTLLGSYDASNWYVYASDSLGDNSGITSLSFKVGGIDVNHASGAGGDYDPGDVAPQFRNYGGTGYLTLQGIFGFNHDVIGVDANPNQADYAFGVHTTQPAYVLWGLGQGPVGVTYHDPGNASASTFTVPTPLLIATGTLLAGQTPFFASGSSPVLFLGPGNSSYVPVPFAGGAANVYTAAGSTANLSATVLVDTPNPEPATLSLLALGALALLRRRRR